jgi:hypothetical protein
MLFALFQLSRTTENRFKIVGFERKAEQEKRSAGAVKQKNSNERIGVRALLVSPHLHLCYSWRDY